MAEGQLETEEPCSSLSCQQRKSASVASSNTDKSQRGQGLHGAKEPGGSGGWPSRDLLRKHAARQSPQPAGCSGSGLGWGFGPGPTPCNQTSGTRHAPDARGQAQAACEPPGSRSSPSKGAWVPGAQWRSGL